MSKNLHISHAKSQFFTFFLQKRLKNCKKFAGLYCKFSPLTAKSLLPVKHFAIYSKSLLLNCKKVKNLHISRAKSQFFTFFLQKRIKLQKVCRSLLQIFATDCQVSIASQTFCNLQQVSIAKL